MEVEKDEEKGERTRGGDVLIECRSVKYKE